MDRHDLVAVAAERGALVDAVLERFFSLAKKRAAPRLHPVAETVLNRVR